LKPHNKLAIRTLFDILEVHLQWCGSLPKGGLFFLFENIPKHILRRREEEKSGKDLQ
jgi:hypothetical protein